MYSNDSVYDVTESDNTTIVLYGLMPEENYFILVRAYQDILGPATALDIATDDGNHRPQCDNLPMYSLYFSSYNSNEYTYFSYNISNWIDL